jgi:hypothetical protein
MPAALLLSLPRLLSRRQLLEYLRSYSLLFVSLGLLFLLRLLLLLLRLLLPRPLQAQQISLRTTN